MKAKRLICAVKKTLALASALAFNKIFIKMI